MRAILRFLLLLLSPSSHLQLHGKENRIQIKMEGRKEGGTDRGSEAAVEFSPLVSLW